MRKFYLAGLMLLGVLAFSVAGTTAAFGLEFSLAQWLVGGALVSTELLVEAVGGVLFEDDKSGAHVECLSGVFDGFVGPESLDLTTEVLDLAGNKIGELVGNGILCLGLGTCVEEEDAEAWPLKLPWKTEVELDLTDGTAWELFFGAAWHVTCLVLGVASTDECTGAEGAEVEVVNVTGGVEALESEVLPDGLCEGALGGGEGDIVFLAKNLASSKEGTLSVSE
jgi:hypothetical protein